MSSTSTETAVAFRLGDGFWSSLPPETATMRLAQAANHARQTIEAADLPVPEGQRLELIAKAAMEVSLLLFVASIHEPTAEELEAVFIDFVERAVADGGMHAATSL